MRLLYSRVDLHSLVTLAASFLHFIGLSDIGECLVDFVSRVGVPFNEQIVKSSQQRISFVEKWEKSIEDYMFKSIFCEGIL